MEYINFFISMHQEYGEYYSLFSSLKDAVDLNTFVLVGLAWYFSRIKKAFRETAEDMGDKIITLQSLVQAEAEAGTGRWEEVRKMWAVTRSQIEATIQNNIDGRKVRSYSSLKRYNYKTIIEKLKEDKAYDEGTMEKLLRMNDVFFSHRRNPSSIDDRMVTEFKALRSEVKKQLAKVDDEDNGNT